MPFRPGNNRGPALIFVLATIVAREVHAQIPMRLGAYVENFDSLSTTGVTAWTDNQTLPGWYASRSHAPTDITEYLTGDGSSIIGGLYSFGSSGSSERAL